MAGRWEQLIVAGEGDTMGHRGLTKLSEQTFGTGGQDGGFLFADEDKAKKVKWFALDCSVLRSLSDSGDHALDL